MKQQEKVLKIPEELFKEFVVYTIINLGSSLMIDASSFLVQLSKNAMISGRIIISLILIALYYGRDPIARFVKAFVALKDDILHEHMNILIMSRASEILLLTKGKVQHRNELQGFEEKMPGSKVIETCRIYIERTWRNKVFFIQKGVDVVSTIILFVGLIVASKYEIENTTLFVVLVFFSIASQLFFSNARMNMKKKHRDTGRKAGMIKKEAYQNILQLEPINAQHAAFLTDNYITASQELFAVNRKIFNSSNIMLALDKLTLAVFSIVVLVIKVYEVGLESANLEMLVSAISIVSIYSQFTQRITKLVGVIEEYRDLTAERNVYQSDFEKIIVVYNQEKQKEEKRIAAIKGITIPEFKISYTTSNSSQPFELVSKEAITFKPGDFVILTGVTGSGKSTLVRILTNNLNFDGLAIKYEAEEEGHPTAVVHQDKVVLGSNSILKEITLGKPDYDKEKLFEILRALHLYEEISERTSDVLQYLDSTGIGHYSSGQVQRLALARTLLNVDVDTHILAFDEATNNQNDEVGLRVLRYIKETYPNSVILFATHQVSIGKQVATKHLNFTHSTDETNFQVVEV